MPAFVIVESSGRTGEMINALLCDPNIVTGVPDRGSDVPVKVVAMSERTLMIVGDNVMEDRHGCYFARSHYR